MNADCAGCMSEDVVAVECDDPECPLAEGHVHLRCHECGYEWTEAGA